MQLVFLVSVVNGIFEELFVAGYIITALREARGMWIAINVSTVVRLLYHLYQGPLGVLTIVPMGLLYGYVYARTRQLWPLIVAHVLRRHHRAVAWACEDLDVGVIRPPGARDLQRAHLPRDAPLLALHEQLLVARPVERVVRHFLPAALADDEMRAIREFLVLGDRGGVAGMPSRWPSRPTAETM